MGYRKAEKARDVTGLLKLLELFAISAAEKDHPAKQAVEALASLVTTYQQHDSNLDYLHKFNTQVDAVENVIGPIEPINLAETLTGTKIDDRTTEEAKTSITEAREKMLAYLFIRNAEKARYGELKHELHQTYLLATENGADPYPKTRTAAYHLLDNTTVKQRKTKPTKPQEELLEASYAQQASTTTKTPKTPRRKPCKNCGKRSHSSKECPQQSESDSDSDSESDAEVGHSHVQYQSQSLHDGWAGM